MGCGESHSHFFGFDVEERIIMVTVSKNWLIQDHRCCPQHDHLFHQNEYTHL